MKIVYTLIKLCAMGSAVVAHSALMDSTVDTFGNSSELAAYIPIEGNDSAQQTFLHDSSSADGGLLDTSNDGYARLHRTNTAKDTIGLTRNIGTIAAGDVGRTITLDAAFAVPNDNLTTTWEIQLDGTGVGGQGKMIINTFGSGNASGGNTAVLLSTVALGTINPQRSLEGALTYDIQAADVGKSVALRFSHYDGSTAGAAGARDLHVDAISYAVLPEVSTNLPVFMVDPIIGNSATNYIPTIGSLAGQATDPDGHELIYTKVSGANWLRILPDGTLAGAPDGSHSGLNVFTVQADNGEGGIATAMLEINVVTGSGRVAYSDDFNSGSGTLGSINGWTGQGAEAKEYNVGSTGALIIHEANGNEKGNGIHAGFFDSVFSTMAGAVQLPGIGDWARLSLDFEVFPGIYGGASVANDNAGLRVSLTDSTVSTNAGYGLYIGTGNAASHTYQEMKGSSSAQAAAGTALSGVDLPENTGLIHLELLLVRIEGGVVLSGELDGNVLAVQTNANTAIATSFDTLALSVASRDHGLRIDHVKIEQPNTSSLWNEFVAAHNNGTNSTLTDFSYAGYHRSEIPVPSVSPASHTYFDVTNYGAVPNDGNSDRDAALAAFAAAHAHSGPAVIYFPPGRHLLDEASDLGKAPLEVKRSNIVVKGAGIGETELKFTEFDRFGGSAILFRSSSGAVSDYWRGDQLMPGKITEQLGEFSVRVDSTSGLAAGQRVNFSCIFPALTPLAEEYFAPHDVLQGYKDRHDGWMNDVFEVHEIDSVVGDVITFREPIFLELPYFVTNKIYRLDNTIEECGIEDLTLIGGYHAQFSHHNGSRQGELHNMLGFDRVFHSWARRLRIADFTFGVKMAASGFNTVSDVVLEGNVGHNLVTLERSTGNLFAYVREQTDGHHGLGGRSGAAGTVFLRCNQYGNLEGHGGLFRNTLYDLNQGEFTMMRGGGAVEFTFHDKGLTFWNWDNTVAGSYDFWPVGSNYGYILRPIIAGLHGETATIADIETDVLAIESQGQAVWPDSLFEAQLAFRLGGLPSWFEANSSSYETGGRAHRIEMMSPTDHTSYASLDSIILTAAVPAELDMDEIARVDFALSGSSRWDGFEVLPKADAKALNISFVPPHEGVWMVRAQLENVRGEISRSDPVTLHVDGHAPVAATIAGSTMIAGADKKSLYSTFEALGGGEAAASTGSSVVPAKPSSQPWHEIEVAFEAERQGIYADFAINTMDAYLADSGRVAAAGKFFDNNPGTSGSVYYYLDTLVQADFGSPQRISRLDIHWNGSAPSTGVRLEIQTPFSYPACLNSMVNDEPLWESGLCRIGGCLRQDVLSSVNGITTLYFPERTVEAVRLLFSSFDGSIAELKFYGSQSNRPVDFYLSWMDGEGLSGLVAGYGADPDEDLRDNLFEYAVGGIPSSGANSPSEVPMLGTDGDYFEYIHPRRRNAAGLGLSYAIETCVDLVDGFWVPASVSEETAIVDADFETVTNRISTAGATNEFLRLKIELD